MSGKSILAQKPGKILIRSTNWIGDAVMTTPAVHSIRKNFPHAEITMLAVPWVADVFAASPDVDSIYIYDKKEKYAGKLKGPLSLAKDLRRHGFDAAILLQNAFEAALIAKLAGIPVRAGFIRDGRGLLLSHGVGITPETRAKHQVHYYQDMLRGLGLTPGPDHLRLPVSEELSRWAQEMIAAMKYQKALSSPELLKDAEKLGISRLNTGGEKGGNVPLIGFNPGAAFGPAKRWPTGKFGQLADLIARHHGDSGCVILVFGTEADRAAAEEIQQFSVRTPNHVLDLTGKTSLQQAISLIDACDAFVSNDSGLMHVAAALNTPTIAIFGSTDHIATGPYSDNAVILRREMECSPCLQSHCPKEHLKCLESISAVEVYEELMKILAKSSSKE